jgi:PBP1b-binding outer membrane lipoprotein LpoB
MKHIIKNISVVLLAAVLFSSCSKETGPLTDVKPTVSVTVSNAMAYRPDPTVSVSKTAVVSPGVVGPIQVIFSIPASSKRTIQSITKVAASTSFAAVQSTGTTGFYTSAPIPGTGTTATFNTTLTEYVAKTGQAISASNTELTRRFYFKITLDDNSVIITEPVRVLVLD